MTNRLRGRRAACVLAIVATASLFAACASNSSSGSSGDDPTQRKPAPEDPNVEPQRGGKLVVSVPSETNGWNPTRNQWADAGSMVGASFIEPMTIIDAEGNPKPWLVEKWTHNDDFTEWELTARAGVKFHNGEPLDAKALKMSIDALYTDGLTKLALESIYKSTEETGPLSVKVYLNRPWSQYPASINSAYMMAPEMLNMEDKGVVKPIGTGPFVFSAWEQGKFLRAKKNPDYWRKDDKGRQLPFLDEIEFQPIPDSNTAEKALQSADVDMALVTSADMAARSDADFNVMRDYNSERTFVMLNTVDSDYPGNAGNPFTNIHARRALAYATDRTEIADLAGEGVRTQTQGYREGSPWAIPEGQTGYVDFDPEKAKQEVEAYKKDTGKSSLSFTITGLTDSTDILQALQDQWRTVGIEANIDVQEQMKYIITIATGAYQAGWFRWYGYLNPDNNYFYNTEDTNKPIGGLSINFTHYTSPQMQANLDGGRTTEDLQQRKKYNDAIIKETNEQLLNIWLYNTPYGIVANKKVKGLTSFQTYPFGNFSPKPWWGEVWIQS